MGFSKSLLDQKPCNMLLQKYRTLYLKGSAPIRESFARFRSIHLLTTGWFNLSGLHLQGCGLSYEDLQLILKCFSKLFKLVVPENHFVCLPACIKESVYLNVLDVSECMKLKEIPELPSRTHEVEARYCPSLTSDSTGILWSQALKEVSRLRILMPKTKIPDWFDHHCNGDTLSFWTHQKFPRLAMGFVFEKHNGILQCATLDCLLSRIHFNIFINGHEEVGYGSNILISPIDDLVLLFDIQDATSWPGLKKALKHDWNHVEIKCNVAFFTTSECGAYVYKQKTQN